jgi:hypothetical protein
MSPQGLLALLHVRPFQPFRVVLTDGEGYDIRHPDLLWVGACEVQIGTAVDPNSTLSERIVVADLLHVVRTEPLGQPQPPQSDGQQQS